MDIGYVAYFWGKVNAHNKRTTRTQLYPRRGQKMTASRRLTRIYIYVRAARRTSPAPAK